MGRSQQLTHGSIELATVGCQTDVILLVHGLQLGMETTDDHVLETVTLDLRPVLNLVRGDILRIAGHIVRGVGIRTLCTNGCHQLVVLIGDEVLRSNLTHRVNLMIGLLTGLGVGQLPISLVTLLNFSEQGGLCLWVVRTKLLRTLEHQVLQVVSQTCGLRWVVLRTCTHSDIRLDPRLLLIHREIHLQPIIQGIYPRLHHIPRYCDILTCL